MDYTLAKLYIPKKGNDWYVYYKVLENGKMKLYKDRGTDSKGKGGLNRIKNLKQRKSQGIELSIALNNKLKKGWRPKNTPTAANDPLKKLPLSELIDELVKIKIQGLRQPTKDSYEGYANIFKKWLSSAGLNNIAPYLIDTYYADSFFGFSDYLVIERKNSGASHNIAVTRIGTLFQMMVTRKIIKENPIYRIKTKPVEVGKNWAFNNTQRDLLKSLLQDNPNLTMFTKMIYNCYIRPTELTKIKIRDIQIEERKILIHSETAKNKRQLPVDVPDSLIDELRERIKGHDPESLLFGKPKLTVSNKKITARHITDIHREYLRKAKLSSDYTLYSWKHTGVVAAWKSGVDAYDLMRQLRHSSLEMLMIYLKTLGLTGESSFSKKHQPY